MEFLKKIFRTEWNEGLKAPKDIIAKFTLSYKNLQIAELKFENGTWEFRYMDAFKAQDELKPLVDFPDVNKTYQSKELWPFFASRIPSLGQPRVQHVIRKDNIDPKNLIELLSRFGRSSISNPFTLQAA